MISALPAISFHKSRRQRPEPSTRVSQSANMTHQGNGSSIPPSRPTASPDYDQLTVEDNVPSQFSEHIPPFHILIEQVELTRSDPYSNGITTPSTIPEFGLARLSVVSNAPAILPGSSTVSGTLAATGSTSITTNGVSQGTTNGIYSLVTESQSATNGIVSQTTERQGATNGTNSSSTESQGATNGIVSQTTEHQGLANGNHYSPTGSQGATNGINTSDQETGAEGITVNTSDDDSQTAEDDISLLEI